MDRQAHRRSDGPRRRVPWGRAFTWTGKRLPPGVLPAAIARVRFVDDPGLDTLRTFATWRHDLGLDRGGGALDLNALVNRGTLERPRSALEARPRLEPPSGEL